MPVHKAYFPWLYDFSMLSSNVSLDLQFAALDFLHLNCGLLRFILFPYATAARPSPDCPISFSELQPESSALGKDIGGVIEASGQCPVCCGAVLATPNPD
jgi:hypothetical protein